MSEKPISCGGFKIDNETIVEQDGVLKAVSGSSGGGVLVVSFIVAEGTARLDSTWQEIKDAVDAGQVVTFIPISGGETTSCMLLVGLKAGDARIPYEVYIAQMAYSSGSVAFQAMTFSGDGADSYPSVSLL